MKWKILYEKYIGSGCEFGRSWKYFDVTHANISVSLNGAKVLVLNKTVWKI